MILKILRGTAKFLFFAVMILSIGIFSTILYLNKCVSQEYKINEGERLRIDSVIPITAVYDGASYSEIVPQKKNGDSFNVDLKMFGAIPFSTVNVKVMDETQVAVLGKPFGMKLYTEGVLVIDSAEIETGDGSVNPAKIADIRIGDYICSADGMEINCNEDLSEIVASSGGNEIEIEIMRNKKRIKTKVKPVYSKDFREYRIGIWVRDSSAGIGTLTFYSPSTDTVCGLGHGICDDDTGKLLTVESGEMVKAKILSVKKGESGKTGELKGSFVNEKIADIKANTKKGVYGNLEGEINFSKLTEVALKQEVENGAAQILCTVEGETPQYYSCEIKKRNSNYSSPTQNLSVTVTDKRLLDKTGGIVQGMSGSPILQNGKLVGAVTHVLVDDSSKGYGIFAENMLLTAESFQKNKKAS